MKVEKSNENINSFGGINFVIDEIRRSGVLELIDNQLGKRPKQSKYSYSDLFLNMWSVFFCGGDCAEDLNEHLKSSLKSVPHTKVADADTVLRVLKSLKTDKEEVKVDKGKTYAINKHDKLNDLNINILLSLKLLEKDVYYDFDYDNEVLPTEKYDTKKTYKMVDGYFPGMGTIGGIPVYFENRDGNMNVKTSQENVLERCFNKLKANNILINRSRMDAGSYTKKVVFVLEKYCKLFYIRANHCEHLTELLLTNPNWVKAEINDINYEVCSIEYQPFRYGKEEKPKTYRLVVMRRKKDSNQLDMFTKDNMEYRCILTNDWLSSEKEVIEYYNERGGEERTIDVLNNDFGWNRMPFSFMEENTVFLMVMMICKNIYTWLITKLSRVYSGLQKTYRLKKFIFRFVTVPAKWIRRGGKMILKIFSSRPYEVLQC